MAETQTDTETAVQNMTYSEWAAGQYNGRRWDGQQQFWAGFMDYSLRYPSRGPRRTRATTDRDAPVKPADEPTKMTKSQKRRAQKKRQKARAKAQTSGGQDESE